MEFLQGFRDDKQFQEAISMIETLEYHHLAGKAIALKAAENFRILRRNGITVRKTIDVLIAAFCIEHGFKLLHDDRDFDRMESLLGLQIRR